MISSCCSADSHGYEDFGLCPDCKEHCDFIEEEKEKSINEMYNELVVKYSKLMDEHIKIIGEYKELLKKVKK